MADDDDPERPLTFVVDLFARDGARPTSLEEAAARKNDLTFGNQTLQRLQLHVQSGRLGPVLYLSYRPVPEEVGPEKTFDLSRRTIATRWRAGALDMELALETVSAGGTLSPLTMIRRRVQETTPAFVVPDADRHKVEQKFQSEQQKRKAGRRRA